MAPLIAPAAFRLPSDETLRARFGHITTWVYDLANTLYPAHSGIWQRIDERIPLFLVELFGIDAQSAHALHKHYYARHGTTLSGLVQEHVDLTERFLDFVHDIDRSSLKPDPVLAHEFGRLPGRKLIFTNGSRSHAILTAKQLGLDGIFEEAFDIVAAGLTPKPAEGADDAFFERCGVDPGAAAMFEDVTRNLAVPKARGMTTTLVTIKAGGLDDREAHDQAISDAANVADFVTDDLSEFLARLNAQLSN